MDDEFIKEEKKEELDMSKKPKEEVAVFGFGALLNHQKKQFEKLDKIQRFLYFMEKRQEEMFEWMQANSKSN